MTTAEERGRRLRFVLPPPVFAFVGSGCLLVLELVAARLIAPDLGVSLYTWTSVIGVVLGGREPRQLPRRPHRRPLAALVVARVGVPRRRGDVVARAGDPPAREVDRAPEERARARSRCSGSPPCCSCCPRPCWACPRRSSPGFRCSRSSRAAASSAASRPRPRSGASSARSLPASRSSRGSARATSWPASRSCSLVLAALARPPRSSRARDGRGRPAWRHRRRGLGVQEPVHRRERLLLHPRRRPAR